MVSRVIFNLTLNPNHYYILVDCPTLNTDVLKECVQWTVAITHYDSWECLFR